MMPVKKVGLYETKGGRRVKIYGFDDLGGNAMMAEGYFEDTKHIGWWEPETGQYGVDDKHSDDNLDIVKWISP